VWQGLAVAQLELLAAGVVSAALADLDCFLVTLSAYSAGQ